MVGVQLAGLVADTPSPSGPGVPSSFSIKNHSQAHHLPDPVASLSRGELSRAGGKKPGFCYPHATSPNSLAFSCPGSLRAPAPARLPVRGLRLPSRPVPLYSALARSLIYITRSEPDSSLPSKRSTPAWHSPFTSCIAYIPDNSYFCICFPTSFLYFPPHVNHKEPGT